MHPSPSPSHDPSEPIAIPRAGEILSGKYRIDGVLGTGGMGVVLAATHLGLHERVAIKMLLAEWLEDESVVRRFAREGRALANIRSEHIVRVLDVDASDGRPYLVLEYLEGKDLEALVREGGPLPVGTAVDYLLQACEALAEAHVADTIHRDLKPANLFLTHRADGSACVKLLDFGISKITSARVSGFRQTLGTHPMTVLGSPHYMSPEQMQSGNVDVRSDIWSLGAILHELIAGSPPFQGATITALCAHVLNDAPAPLVEMRPEVPPALVAVILRCLEKNRARRFASLAELARALAPFGSPAARASAERIRRVVDGEAGSAPIVGDSLPSPPLTRPIGGYLLAAIACLAVGAAGWKIVAQERAIHASLRALEAAPVAVSPAAASTTLPPPVAPPPVPTSVASTTGALVRGPTATSTPVATAPTPIPVVQPTALPIAPAAPAPPHAHHVHVWRRAPAPPIAGPTEPAFAAPPPAVIAPPPAPPPTTIPGAAEATDPNQLFDQRK